MDIDETQPDYGPQMGVAEFGTNPRFDAIVNKERRVDAFQAALLDSKLPTRLRINVRMIETNSTPVHENLDTAYLNLAALLRYLQERNFEGRVHVELDEYEADVFLKPLTVPRVREVDHLTGRRAEGDEVFQRLLTRSAESGGLVSVYAGKEDQANGEKISQDHSNVVKRYDLDPSASNEDREWAELLILSGEVIAAIERACLSGRFDFEPLFRAVRLELSDDYPFLDPLTECFEYSTGGVVRMHARPHSDAYAASICESLRRVVSRIASSDKGERLRERAALELAVLARRRRTQLTRYKLTQQFDRIAGTRVL